jgi:putative ABC transport system permease protein
MEKIFQILRRLVYYFRRAKFDRELEEELRFHLELKLDEKLNAGLSRRAAYDAARREFGNQILLMETSREIWSMRIVETFFQDLRFALRMLLKKPGFTAVALLSLALGVGANTAIFSVIYGVLISPYPYAKPYEIWAPSIRVVNSQQGRGGYRVSEYLEMKKVPAFADVMATGLDTVLLTGDNRAPESFPGVLLTGNAFNFLGVPPALGRTIQPSDIKTNGDAEPVVVLGYKTWLRLFDGDPGAIGKTLRLNDQPHVVVGVMPPRFGWFGSETFWLPMPVGENLNRMVNTIVRLQPGTSPKIGEEQLQALHLRLASERPENFPREAFTSRLTNYMDITTASGEMKSSLWILFGVVAFLLLIACANVANLQLARSTARVREIAVRTALGAGRLRILRQLLTESVLLSVVGGALGVLFAVAAVKAIVAYMPEFYVPNEARIELNLWILLFTAAVSILTGVLSGLAPAIRSSRPDLIDGLKDSTRGAGASVGGSRMRSTLVIVEVALAVVLLVGAGLMVRSFMAMNKIDIGFRPDGVLLAGLPLPPKRYATLEQRNLFAQDLLGRIKNLPGVEAVSIGNGGTPYAGLRSAYTIEGQPKDDSRRVAVSLISPDYLRAMGVPLRSGRELTEQEMVLGDHVALINEAARKLWPEDVNPIGRRIRIDALERPGGNDVQVPANPSGDVTIVGVIGDTKNDSLDRNAVPSAYMPYTLLAPSQRNLAIRTHGEPMAMVNAVREQIRSIDPDQPMRRPIAMEEVFSAQYLQPRFNMALFSMFAGLGLLLTLAGIYSVLSYQVTERTHEIGVRMALGADRGEVFSLMIRMGAKLVGVGLALGLIASLLLTKFLRTLLFQIKPTDPWSILAVIVLLSIAAFLACYLPARRAARLDPWVALRQE